MYPRNAASPPPMAIGAVVQISDGAVQTTGVSARVKTGTGSWAAAANTPTCDTTSGIWEYTPSQSETNAASFQVALYKASCIPVSQTVVTSASAVAGYAGLDWSLINAPTTTQGLSGTTISTSQAVASVSGAVGSVTGNVGGNVAGSVASVTGAVGSVTGAVGSVTAAVTLPSIPANWLTAAGIAASALNGKGDWNIGKTGYSLTATTGLGNQTANITGNLSGSVGSVTGAVGSVTGAVGSVTGNIGGNVVGSVGSVTAAVTLPSIPAGWITAAGIATNAIDADALAADAITELQAGLATASALSTVAGYLDTEVAAILAAVDTEVAAIKTKTDSLTFTVAGQVDANVQRINDVPITGDGQSGTEFGV